MHFFKSIASLTLALVLSSVEATPLPSPPTAVASGYVPLSERTFTAEQHAEHERILKRSSIGWNDWSCKPEPGKNPLIMVHGLGMFGLFSACSLFAKYEPLAYDD